MTNNQVQGSRAKPIIAEAWQPIESAPKDGTRILTYSPRALDQEITPIRINYWHKNCWWRTNSTHWPPTHWMPLPPAPVDTRPEGQVHDTFWNKVAIAAADECWLWQGALDDGYGRYWNGTKSVYSHRHSVFLDGREIPEGMVIDHICRNRACVNPAHLRVVDRRANVHENSDAVAFHKAQQTHCIHGHELSGDNVKIKRGKRYCRECNRIYQRKHRVELRGQGLDACTGSAVTEGEAPDLTLSSPTERTIAHDLGA